MHLSDNRIRLYDPDDEVDDVGLQRIQELDLASGIARIISDNP